MSKHDLQNEQLDQIGQTLLEAARVKDDEIEKIVGAPHLFDSIKARIKAEEQRQNADSPRGFRDVFLVWNWRKAGVAFASLIIIFGLVNAIVLIKQDSPQDLVERISVPQIQPRIELIEIPQPQLLTENSTEIEKTKSPANRNRNIVRQAVFRKATAKLRKPQRQTDFAKRQTGNEPNEEFYAVTYAGDPGEAGEDLQIVRAEMSPSSLFALGVNLSMENENSKIKTDMLVGSDGVVRGIRFIK